MLVYSILLLRPKLFPLSAEAGSENEESKSIHMEMQLSSSTGVLLDKPLNTPLFEDGSDKDNFESK
jgi:hypothetical protein